MCPVLAISLEDSYGSILHNKPRGGVPHGASEFRVRGVRVAVL